MFSRKSSIHIMIELDVTKLWISVLYKSHFLKIFFFCSYFFFCSNNFAEVRVGVLFAASGTMSFSERPVLEALLREIKKINISGGVLGHQIVPVIRDSVSNWRVAKQQAKDLILKDKVSAIFGCWTSACRKEILPVIEEYNHILFYPLTYEGLEESRNIIYMGGTPNQIVIPALKFLLKRYQIKKVALIGSDYVYPRSVNEILKDFLKSKKIKSKSFYVPLGKSTFGKISKALRKEKYDLIINTINGSSNVHFFRTLERIKSTTPVVSYALTKNEIKRIEMNIRINFSNYIVHSTLFGKKNENGHEQTYENFARYSVEVWKKLVEEAKSFKPSQVLKKVKDVELLSEGKVMKFLNNNHIQHGTNIYLTKDNREKLIHATSKVDPVPFYTSRTQEQWKRFLNELLVMWNGRWFYNKIVSNKSATKVKVNLSVSPPFISDKYYHFKDYGAVGNKIQKTLELSSLEGDFVFLPKTRILQRKNQGISFLEKNECRFYSSKPIHYRRDALIRLSHRYGKVKTIGILRGRRFKPVSLYKNIKLTYVSNLVQLIDMLNKNRIDAVYMDLDEFNYFWILSNPKSLSQTFYYKNLHKTPMVLCFKNKVFRNKVNDVLVSTDIVDDIVLPSVGKKFMQLNPSVKN